MTSQRIPKWDEFFIGMAEYVSTKSKDPNTKVGAVMVNQRNSVLSIGFNGPPRGVDDTVPERMTRPTKYVWFSHGEENTILNAASVGIPTLGAKLYLNWSPYTVCANCARGIIQAGISEVIGPKRPFLNPAWKESFEYAQQMFKEAKILLREVDS